MATRKPKPDSSQKKTKIVVSDFHIGKGRFLNDGTPNILEDFHFDAKFVEFLEFYSSGEYAEANVELIINGDFLNLLQTDYLGAHSYMITEKMTAYMVHAIIIGHPEVFDALQDFAAKANHSIAYVIGNHDQALLFPAARRILIDCIGPDIRFYDSHYDFSGVRVEHGHMYESVNRCDLRNYLVEDPAYPEPVLNLPWASYFVAAYLPKLKKERPFVDKVKPFTGYMRWALIHDSFFAIRAGIYMAMSFLRLALLQDRHPMLDFRLTWSRLKGITFYPSFLKVAWRVMRRNPHLHTVIFGHTHVLKYKQWSGCKEYFNIGSWNEFTSLDVGDFGLQYFLTYAFIEQTAPDRKPQTRLKEWKGRWEATVDATNMPLGPRTAF